MNQVSEGVLSGQPSLQFKDAIDSGQSGMGNQAFLQFIGGLNAQGAGEATHAIAETGIRGAGEPMTHLDTIQASFGHHDVSDVRQHLLTI